MHGVCRYPSGTLILPLLCHRPGFLVFLINRNWSEARQKRQARLYWGPCCCSSGEWEQTTGSLACSLPEPGRAGSFYGVRVGVCPGVGPEGWLRCFAHPLGGGVCRGHAQYPAFAPDPLHLLQALQKWQLGFLVSLYLLSRICPNYSCVQLLLVPYSFFVFCSLRRGVQVQALQQCSKGCQVPACLIWAWGSWEN